MPDKIVDHRNFDRQGSSQNIAKAEPALQPRQRSQLHPNADAANQVELQPGDHAGQPSMLLHLGSRSSWYSRQVFRAVKQRKITAMPASPITPPTSNSR